MSIPEGTPDAVARVTSRKLHGKVALVTGSSRGIGAAIARLFASHGALVAIHGRDRNALATVRSQIESDGGRVLDVVADVTHLDELEAMRARIEENLGPIEILVANAGGNLTPPHSPIEEISEGGWRASVDANLTGTFLTLKSILPGMKSRRSGRIVTMSSAAARRPTAMSPAPYTAAKAAIQLLTQIAAAQAGPFGVRVNCIAPETILTEDNTKQIPPEVQNRLADEHPLRRLGTPLDVAEAALFLVSDASEWLTGLVLDVAGGSVLR
jgi:3-oxoacyl-[acyl-carrier protein] reductase